MLLPGTRTSRARPGTPWAITGIAIDLFLAALVGLIRNSGGSVGLRHAEGPLPTIAFVVAFAAPGILALIGVVIDRPVLYGAAGFACAPIIVFSIVAFPMIIPCVLLFVAFAKAQTGTRSPSLLAGCILAGFLVPILGGLWKLVTDTAQFTYTFSGGSESGDYSTPHNAALCIAIIAADIVVAATLAWISPARDNSWR
jgi:hypothetical protein